jgi:hypothetical protein
MILAGAVAMDPTATHSELRFSTDVLPPSERLVYLREVLGRSICRVDLSPVEEGPPGYVCSTASP